MIPRKLHQQMTVTLRTSEGHQFKGEFGDPNGFPRPRKEVQNIPHQALTVSKNSLASDGDLVTYQGTEFLLCGQHHLTSTKIFLALQVKSWVRWTRQVEVMDPILRVKRDTQEVVLSEALPVILDPIRSLEEQSFQKAVYRVLTGADLRGGDTLNGTLRVLQVTELFGLKIAELA